MRHGGEEVALQPIQLLEPIVRFLELSVLLLEIPEAFANGGQVHVARQERLVSAEENEIEGPTEVPPDLANRLLPGSRHLGQELFDSGSIHVWLDGQERLGHALDRGRQERPEHHSPELAMVVANRHHVVNGPREARVRSLPLGPGIEALHRRYDLLQSGLRPAMVIDQVLINGGLGADVREQGAALTEDSQRNAEQGMKARGHLPERVALHELFER